MLTKIKQEEAKDRLIDSAFLAFQMGAGGQETFGQYLQELGLSGEKVGIKPITKEEAFAKAERIKKALKKRH